MAAESNRLSSAILSVPSATRSEAFKDHLRPACRYCRIEAIAAFSFFAKGLSSKRRLSGDLLCCLCGFERLRYPGDLVCYAMPK